jgi:hypothetical protein
MRESTELVSVRDVSTGATFESAARLGLDSAIALCRLVT